MMKGRRDLPDLQDLKLTQKEVNALWMILAGLEVVSGKLKIWGALKYTSVASPRGITPESDWSI